MNFTGGFDLARSLFRGWASDQSPAAPPTPAYARILWLAAGVLYVSLYVHLPIAVIPTFVHDDAWYLGHAQSLVSGHWFGHFSQMTLMKGPGYAFFLALNAMLGLPVTLSQALFYLAACSLFSRALFRLSGSAPLGLALFLATLWHPSIFPDRPIRDDIYAAETLLYLGCLIELLFLPAAGRARALWAVAGGLALSGFWMTREEGVWIMPATAVLCAVAIWRKKANLAGVLVITGAALAAGVAISLGNFIAYRTFDIVDFKSGAYSNAVRALQSVRVGEAIAYVPVPAKAREAIYKVSPAFARLRPYFDGPGGQGWVQISCQHSAANCGDYLAGWFVWALRDAVASIGRYDSPADADAYYREITAEVQAACRSGRLHCAGGPIAYMPTMAPSQWRLIPSKLQLLADLMLVRSDPRPPVASNGDPDSIRQMLEFEGHPRHTPAPGEYPKTLAGWLHGAPNAWLQARCAADGKSWVMPIAHRPSPDIAAYFHDPAATDRRFAEELPTGAQCRLQPAGATAADTGLAYDTLYSGQSASLGASRLFLDKTGNQKTFAFAEKAYLTLFGIYRIVVPILCLAAALAYLAHLVMMTRRAVRIDAYWWLTHALWLALACRMTILLLVDISSFDAITVLYLSAAFPLSVAALLLTLGLPFRRQAQLSPA